MFGFLHGGWGREVNTSWALALSRQLLSPRYALNHYSPFATPISLPHTMIPNVDNELGSKSSKSGL